MDQLDRLMLVKVAMVKVNLQPVLVDMIMFKVGWPVQFLKNFLATVMTVSVALAVITLNINQTVAVKYAEVLI